jgi:hypothetical protein
MSPKLLIRLASGCLLFFAMGHTVGHFTRHNVTDPKAKEVLQAMSENHFDMFGEMRSYDENYTGMSANLILTLISFAALLWILSGTAIENKKRTTMLLIPILFCVSGFAATGFLYFFHLPAISCLGASALLLITIGQLNRKKIQ